MEGIEEYTTTRAMRFMPQMLVATIVVAVVPVVLVWWLRASGLITSAWLCIVVAVVVSLALSAGGSFWWTRRRKSSDIMFSELLLWGWLRRYRVERQLVGATELLGLLPGAEPSAAAEDVASRERLLKQLSTALDAQDPYLDGHSRRVSRYAATVARRMGLSDEQVKQIRAAGAVHDVGKLRVPPELLRKATPLTDAEFEAVMRHAEEGAEMVGGLGDDELTEIVRHHHERFDGFGYPAGLRGDEIPLGARIVAVADTFDAITSARPYRPAARHKQAIDVLIENAGTQLDPEVVRAFLRCYAGRRASVMWIILAVSPQRALAWMRHGSNGGEPVPVVPVGELAASTIGRAIVFAAAVGTSVGVGVARYENHVLHNANALPVAAAAPFSYQLKPASPGHHSAAKQAARKSSPTIRFAIDRSGRPIAKGSRAQIRSGKRHPGTATPSTSTTGAPTPGSSAPPGSGNAPAGKSHGHNPPAGGGGHTAPTAVTAPAPTPAPAPAPPASAPATPAVTVNGPTSTPIVSTPPPPVTPGGGGGGTTTGGGGSPGGGTGGGGTGGGGTGGHHHGGPGDGGWGPPGHPHDGPGDGGWGPGGNPDPGGSHGGRHGFGLGLVLRLP